MGATIGNMMIITISSIGAILSIYTLYIEYQFKKNKEYKAVCDISNRVSCSRTFHSRYGKTLNISNGFWGLLFYLVVIGLVLLGHMDLVFYAALFSVLFSLRLAYILYFKMKNLCLVCSGIYIVNILLLIFVWMNY